MQNRRSRQLLDRSGLICRVGISLVICGALAIPMTQLAIERGLQAALTGVAILFFVFMRILPVGRYVDLPKEPGNRRSTDDSPEEISRPKDAFESYSRPRRSASLLVIGILLVGTALYHAATTIMRNPPNATEQVTLYWLSVVLGTMGAGAIVLWLGHHIGRQAAETYIAQLNDLLEESPDDAETILRLGEALTLFERYEDAIAVYDRGTNIADRWVEITLACGHAQYAAGNLDEAESRFTSVLEKDPDNIEALVERGSVYLDQGDLDRAKVDFAHVEKLEPNEADEA